MTTAIDPRVVELIDVNETHVEAPGPGELFRIGDGETYEIGHEAGGVITVETIDRGSSTGVDLVTSDVLVLQTYLALQSAGAWRGAHGLDRLTNDRLSHPSEYAVIDEGESMWGVQRPDGTGGAHCLRDSRAQKLAVALSYPLDVVVAAIKHPTGEPIWTEGRTWRR